MKEDATYPTLTTQPRDFDKLWAEADLPEAQCQEWREVTRMLDRTPETAARLDGVGWTPQLVREARSNPDVYWPAHLRDKSIAEMADETSTAHLKALAVLADHITDYHLARAELARGIRNEYFAALHESGWRHGQIGNLIGVSKQRIQKVLQDLKSRRTTSVFAHSRRVDI